MVRVESEGAVSGAWLRVPARPIGEPVVRLEGVHKSFGDNEVLKGSTSASRAVRC